MKKLNKNSNTPVTSGFSKFLESLGMPISFTGATWKSVKLIELTSMPLDPIEDLIQEIEAMQKHAKQMFKITRKKQEYLF